MFFRKKSEKITYDPAKQKPVIKCSICNGEQVAGLCDIATGAFTEVMLIRGESDLLEFAKRCGIEGEIEKIY